MNSLHLHIVDSWTIEVTWHAQTARLSVPLSVERSVRNEPYASLPEFKPLDPGFWKGVCLSGVRTQETSAKNAMEPQSLVLKLAPDGTPLRRGVDYDADVEWGTVGRLPGGCIGSDQPVFIDYRHGVPRLDSIVVDSAGSLRLRPGTPAICLNELPDLAPGETRLANVWVPARLEQLSIDHLFPILDDELRPATPCQGIDRLLPRTMAKLRSGERIRILAWGDSVTEGAYLAPDERWQVQFVDQLKQRFPSADVELLHLGWGGRNTSAFLGEPSGSKYNYQEQVLGAKADLIISEFVNDAYLNAQQVDEQYGRLLADFRASGSEWVILTPHYVRGDWMGLSREREIDEDPRPYVHALRAFAQAHDVALADAAALWGRLWRSGIPYTIYLGNSINHPDGRGQKLFADALMSLFEGQQL